MKKVRETATAEEVIKSLPGLLKERPELRWEIYRIISDEFVRRDEFYEYMKRSDERFERLFNELRESREESNRRFEAMERRFEEMREESDRRFEAMERRFETIDRRFEAMERRFDNLEDWVGIVVGGFQRRAGRKLEDAIAGTLRLALKRDIKPENITMRKKIKDDEGMIGPKGREYEIDLYITDGESLIFEIKSYAEEEDVERFNDKAELAKKKLNLKRAKKAIITLEKHPSFVRFCEQMGIEVG
ncbi:MAG: hypothetical protein C4B56_03545 [Candidatus Methanophagaceae archaeon]|nr:MAG: hypothetical protein C4B56_03545 [Methanophagales archaeon]